MVGSWLTTTNNKILPRKTFIYSPLERKKTKYVILKYRSDSGSRCTKSKSNPGDERSSAVNIGRKEDVNCFGPLKGVSVRGRERDLQAGGRASAHPRAPPRQPGPGAAFRRQPNLKIHFHARGIFGVYFGPSSRSHVTSWYKYLQGSQPQLFVRFQALHYKALAVTSKYLVFTLQHLEIDSSRSVLYNWWVFVFKPIHLMAN